jgi:hypothetical protein
VHPGFWQGTPPPVTGMGFGVGSWQTPPGQGFVGAGTARGAGPVSWQTPGHGAAGFGSATGEAGGGAGIGAGAGWISGGVTTGDGGVASGNATSACGVTNVVACMEVGAPLVTAADGKNDGEVMPAPAQPIVPRARRAPSRRSLMVCCLSAGRWVDGRGRVRREETLSLRFPGWNSERYP